MPLRISRSSLVARDIGQIWSYIAKDNVAAADRMVQSLNDAIRLLARNPELGSAVEIRAGMRCKPVHRRYLILYIATRHELQVLRILHSARDYERILSDE
jgi:toxin ParE1/3/4